MADVAVFVVAAATSMLASALLVARIERVSERLGMPEALLGLTAALAADLPEITSAVSATAAGHPIVGLGVALGSNVFNLAALLGLTALLAGRIRLHRRVVELEGGIALVFAVACLAVVAGSPAPPTLALTLVVFVPYLAVSALGPASRARLALPHRWRRWLVAAVAEEEAELATAIRPEPGDATDAVLAFVAAVVVVVASLVMTRQATSLGEQASLPDVVTGAVVLAAITSLPNAVAAWHLVSHGRGQAALSEAFNSNAFNALVGLLIPASIAGLGTASGARNLVGVAYLGMTALVVILAWRSHGLDRLAGFEIVAAYLLFIAVLLSG